MTSRGSHNEWAIKTTAIEARANEATSADAFGIDTPAIWSQLQSRELGHFALRLPNHPLSESFALSGSNLCQIDVFTYLC